MLARADLPQVAIVTDHFEGNKWVVVLEKAIGILFCKSASKRLANDRNRLTRTFITASFHRQGRIGKQEATQNKNPGNRNILKRKVT